MNRKEARELLATIIDDPVTKPYHELRPWQRLPASCGQCPDPATRRICRDGEFLCEEHADVRLNELVDLYGGASSCGVRWPWGMWMRGVFYWHPYYWLTYKGGPFRFFMIRRTWYRWLFPD